MTTDEYQRSGKPEIDAFFDMGYKIGRTTKAVARNLFGCECASQNASTSDEALPMADVVGQSELLVCEHLESDLVEIRKGVKLCKCSVWIEEAN